MKNDYFNASKSPAIGLLAVLPLIIVYEWLSRSLFAEEGIQLRNMVDSTFRQIFDYLGLGHNLLLVIFMVAVVLALLLDSKQAASIHLHYFGLVVIESAFYAVLLGSIVSRLTATVLSMSNNHLSDRAAIMLSLGAGAYEELVFRGIIYQFTALPLIRYLDVTPLIAFIQAAVLSSLLFSGLHYLGTENFTWYTAYYRFFAGLFFCGLYQLRGLGVAAWTHALYDLFIYLT